MKVPQLCWYWLDQHTLVFLEYLLWSRCFFFLSNRIIAQSIPILYQNHFTFLFKGNGILRAGAHSRFTGLGTNDAFQLDDIPVLIIINTITFLEVFHWCKTTIWIRMNQLIGNMTIYKYTWPGLTKRSYHPWQEVTQIQSYVNALLDFSVRLSLW